MLNLMGSLFLPPLRSELSSGRSVFILFLLLISVLPRFPFLILITFLFFSSFFELTIYPQLLSLSNPSSFFPDASLNNLRSQSLLSYIQLLRAVTTDIQFEKKDHKIMLQHYHQPASSQQPKVKEEDSIVNSFYEERKSRSANQKYHNLLKKNISFFHPQQQGANCQPQNTSEENRNPNSRTRITSQPPLPPQPSTLKKQRSTSHFQVQSISISSPRQSDQQYLNKLQQKLNKRININSYLSNYPEKDNEDSHSSLRQHNINMPSNLSRRTDKNSQKYMEGESSFNQSSFKMHDQVKKDHFQSRTSLMSLGKENKIVELSRKYSLKGNQEYEVTKNNGTDRSQPQSLGFDAKLSRKSHQSGRISHLSSQQQEEEDDFPQSNSLKKPYEPYQELAYNYLSKEQLSSLHENSHSPNHYKSQQIKKAQLNYSYITPDEESTYKSRIQDLENQMAAMKQTQKKEQKFIQSIQKMRKIMMNERQDEPCSLKELWRWIKQLPRK